ncbi:MAG: DUF2986 domain-containing protein [Spongiibacteraceae bacterium]
MNRKKKINKEFNKRAKQARAKNNLAAKPRYISKAERAAAAEEENPSLTPIESVRP